MTLAPRMRPGSVVRVHQPLPAGEGRPDAELSDPVKPIVCLHRPQLAGQVASLHPNGGRGRLAGRLERPASPNAIIAMDAPSVKKTGLGPSRCASHVIRWVEQPHGERHGANPRPRVRFSPRTCSSGPTCSNSSNSGIRPYHPGSILPPGHSGPLRVTRRARWDTPSGCVTTIADLLMRDPLFTAAARRPHHVSVVSDHLPTASPFPGATMGPIPDTRTPGEDSRHAQRLGGTATSILPCLWR